MKKVLSLLFFFLLVPIVLYGKKPTDCYIIIEESMDMNKFFESLLTKDCIFPEQLDGKKVKKRLIKKRLLEHPVAGHIFKGLIQLEDKSLSYLLSTAVAVIRTISPPNEEKKNYSGEEIKRWFIDVILYGTQLPLSQEQLNHFNSIPPEVYKLVHDNLRDAYYKGL